MTILFLHVSEYCPSNNFLKLVGKITKNLQTTVNEIRRCNRLAQNCFDFVRKKNQRRTSKYYISNNIRCNFLFGFRYKISLLNVYRVIYIISIYYVHETITYTDTIYMQLKRRWWMVVGKRIVAITIALIVPKGV